MKICNTCKEIKDIFLFREYFDKRNNKFYRRSDCKKCAKLYNKTYSKQWSVNNKKELKEYRKQWRFKNTEYITKYEIENKESILKNRNIRHTTRIKIDTLYKLRSNISSTIYKSLHKRNSSKCGLSIMNYLFYSIEELRQYLESKFESWMNWSNQGVYLKDFYKENDMSTWTWHIDHIIPQSKLLYSSMEDDNFQKCWALENLRPFKSIDNIKKGNKPGLTADVFADYYEDSGSS